MVGPSGTDPFPIFLTEERQSSVMTMALFSPHTVGSPGRHPTCISTAPTQESAMTGLDTRPPSSPRSRKKAIWITVAVVAVVGVAVGLALFQPWKIFTRNTVNEAVPVAAAVQNDAVTAPALSVSSMNTSAPAAPGTPAPTQTTAPIQTTAAATTPETSTPEAPATEAPAPAAAPTEPVVLATGTFVDGKHATS